MKVDESNPTVNGAELEEYVVTDQIRRALTEIIDQFISSRNEIPEDVCGWVSGFFGSGKSHFLKVLGYVLSNKKVKLEGDREVGASGYFCTKHSIPNSIILEKELRTRSIFVNMLNYDREKGPSITRIVYEALFREVGLSEVGWIAEIERNLQRTGLWEDFLKQVERSEKKPWQEIRNIQMLARPVLAKSLIAIDPKHYPNEELAQKSIDDVRAGFTIDQTRLAKMLLEFANEIDETEGRVVILLDEIGLYVGKNTDRLTDLQSVAEQIALNCKGKVWLFVSAQEALEEKIPSVEAIAGQFQKLRDRFQIRVSLTPENIDVVVKKRLLEKTADKARLKQLVDLYDKNSGTLVISAMLQDTARDFGGLFTRIDREQFIESYPFMPYHIRLMQEIFNTLRAPVTVGISGRERAILQVGRSILIGVKGGEGLAAKSVGTLASFDMVYDVVDEELKSITPEHQASIAGEISKMPSKGKLRVDSVAKVIFLLSQVGAWLPCKLENITALLYPSLGANKNDLENDIKQCLTELKKGRWIVEEEGKYRFLSDVERSFEQDVERQTANETEKREAVQQIMGDVLGDLKTYNYLNLRSFNVHIETDGKESSTPGYLKLEFYSPLRALKQADLMDSVRSKSLSNRDTIYWICKADERFEAQLEQLIRRKKAIAAREQIVNSKKEIDALDKHKQEVDSLEDDELPRILRVSASEGTIVSQGEEKSLSGSKNLSEIFNEQMKELGNEVFTEFKYAGFLVEKDEHVGAILAWQGGKLPRIYRDLQLVDEQGDIHLERPVPSRVFAEVRRRAESSPEDQTGNAISSHFEAPPYGWDPRVVRLSLAALFKNGSILVIMEGKSYGSPSDGRAQDAFTSARIFNRARFTPGRQITPDQRTKASQLISRIFGEKGGNSIEEVDKALENVLTTRLQQCERLSTISTERGLPRHKLLSQLRDTLQKILGAGQRSERVIVFLEKENLAILQESAPILASFAKFEPNLSQYYRVREFGRNIGPQLLGVVKTKSVEKKIEELQNNITADDFYARWPTTFSIYQDLLAQYYNQYKEKHEAREQSVKAAIASLRVHPFLKELKEADRKQYLSRLEELSCESAKMAMDEESLVCKKCGASLTDLTHHLEMIQARRQEVRKDLDRAWESAHKGEEVSAVTGFTSMIRAKTEISAVSDRLQGVSERAIKQGKSVRVEVDVE